MEGNRRFSKQEFCRGPWWVPANQILPSLEDEREVAFDKLLQPGCVTSHSCPPRMPFGGTIPGVRRPDLLFISSLPGLCDPGGPQSLLIRDGWEDYWILPGGSTQV